MKLLKVFQFYFRGIGKSVDVLSVIILLGLAIVLSILFTGYSRFNTLWYDRFIEFIRVAGILLIVPYAILLGLGRDKFIGTASIIGILLSIFTTFLALFYLDQPTRFFVSFIFFLNLANVTIAALAFLKDENKN